MTTQLSLAFSAPRKALNVDRIATLNCGLGRDSIAMVCLLVEGKLRHNGRTVLPSDIDYVVFSDTGCEWEHTYSLIPAIRQKLAAVGVPFIVLSKPSRPADALGSAPTTWEAIEHKAATGGYHVSLTGVALPSIIEEMTSRDTVVNFKGQCTDKHKIAPMRRLIEDAARVRFGVATNRAWGELVRKGDRQPHLALIGIAADEQKRIDKAAKAKGRDYVVEAYPLHEMSIAKADEAPILARRGLGHVRKSGCYLCPFQPASWYWALSVADPTAYELVVAYEARALANNPKMHATAAKQAIPAMVASWRESNPSASVEDVLAKTYEQCPAAARTAQRAA